jgi:putative transport protein
MTAVPSLRLHFGDVLQVVGDQASIQRAAAFLGNSLKSLNEAHFIPLFIGLALSIVLGTLPVTVPGLPQPLRLGLAGHSLWLWCWGAWGTSEAWSGTCRPT